MQHHVLRRPAEVLDRDGEPSGSATLAADHGKAQGLRLVGLEKRYGDAVAVTNVDLDVRAGEFITLLGPSGSGKSTTLAMIAGFERPSRGQVMFGQRDVTALTTHKRELGMVFQGYALFPHLSVFDNVAFPLKLRGVRGSALKARVHRALEMVALSGFEKRLPRELSGGQQQRVALARAVVHDPPILLMDEPLSALDKSLRQDMQAEIRRIHRSLGTTVIYVTHDQEEALSLSDRIVVMRAGQIEQIGSPQDVYEHPASRFVASFLGEANFLTGSGFGGSAGQLTKGVSEDGTPIVGRATTELHAGHRATIVLRPEDAILDDIDETRYNRLLVEPTELVYLGDRIRCVGTLHDGSTCIAWFGHAAATKLAIGMPIVMGWPHERVVVLADEAEPPQ